MFMKIFKKASVLDPESVPLQPTKGICSDCLWLHRNTGNTCEAFPLGIPMEVLLGVFDHHYHYLKDGSDDEGIIFTPNVPE